MKKSWNLLLEKIGIAKSFFDAAQNRKEYIVDDALLLKMVNYLGYNLKSIDDSEKLLSKLDKDRWLYAVEPIYVVRLNKKQIDIVVKKEDVDDLELSIRNSLGDVIEVEYNQTICEEKQIGKIDYCKILIDIISDMKPDYYKIEMSIMQNKYHTILAVTPDKCYVSDSIKGTKKWGFAIQLYSLRSKRNWGVGDFTDLSNFAKMCKSKGADVIGVNPLNVLFHDYPENASPYSSISRLFLNPIYIDVEKVNGFKKEYLKGKENILLNLRQTTDINYSEVYSLKIGVLNKIFENLDENSVYYKKFQNFCDIKGSDLDDLATYQVIYSEYCKKVNGGWKSWPKGLQNPKSQEVKNYKNNNINKVNFFKFLQFVAEEQLCDVKSVIDECGLKIGLYRDLPVGLCKDSVELWAGNDLFIKNCGAGAPPDAFFPKGQKWCLGAFNPYTLKACAYEPFIKILRSAMDKAGALRIDHVMSLMRLYIIPECEEDGTYVYYNFDDMLGILALESYLNKCMIVGESIGNVPDGFIEKIHDRGIYSLSVLWSERWNGYGDFKLPQDFSEKSFCSVGTHDMAPLKMRWFGYDIETMYKLKMLSDEERLDQYKGREDERRRLLGALDFTGVWPEKKQRQGDCLYGEGYPYGIMEAVEKYVSSSKCEVFLAQLEDIFGVEVLQNLPGTDVDKHPNWRRKIPVNIEDYDDNQDFKDAIEAICR